MFMYIITRIEVESGKLSDVMYIELPNTEISTNNVCLKIVCFKWSWDLKLHVCPHFTLWYMYMYTVPMEAAMELNPQYTFQRAFCVFLISEVGG